MQTNRKEVEGLEGHDVEVVLVIKGEEVRLQAIDGWDVLELMVALRDMTRAASTGVTDMEADLAQGALIYDAFRRHTTDEEFARLRKLTRGPLEVQMRILQAWMEASTPKAVPAPSGFSPGGPTLGLTSMDVSSSPESIPDSSEPSPSLTVSTP